MTEVINKNGISFDIDAIATDLNNKMDRDGLNSLASVCVESYVNGNSWYRVYSDGWCEQGGTATSIASAEGLTITLLKSFVNADYVLVNGMNADYENANASDIAFHKVASDRFTVTIGYSGTFYAMLFSWQACGYIN